MSRRTDFHAVEFMRRRREEIDREDENLSWGKRARRALEAVSDDPAWQRVKDRVVPSRHPAAR